MFDKQFCLSFNAIIPLNQTYLGGIDMYNEQMCFSHIILNSVTNTIYYGGIYLEHFLDNCFQVNMIPLPIEMDSYYTSCDDRYNVINWATISEFNNDYFEIEKSFNAIDFVTVGKINSKGNSSELTNYSWKDEMYSNMVYYRLSQVDFDGTKQTYPTLSSACIGMNFDAFIYPNPSKSSINMQINSSLDEFVVFTIINAEGKLIRTFDKEIFNGKNIFEISDDNMEPGIYFIKIQRALENSVLKWIKN